jgi:nucleotide-binding universal stress UspA family protein
MRTADATGLRPEALLLSGRPAEVLRKYAVEEGYDLIVVGRRESRREPGPPRERCRSARTRRPP